MNNPKLRFKADDGSEFSAWEETEIGKIGTFTKGAALSKADISDTGTPFVLYGELYTTYKEVAFTIRRKTEAVVDEKYYSKMGDVVIPTSGESPEEISTATCIMVPNVILAGDLNIFRSDTIDGRIMSYILNYQAKNKIATIAQGKSIVHIQAKELSKVKIKYPVDVNEQHKIASFLSTIDDIITTTEAELTAWEERKKGVMQKIFNHEVRFKVDDGSEFPEWEDKRLGDDVNFINGRAYSQDELLVMGKYQVLRVGNLFTNDTYYYSNMELEEDKYIEDGDLIYAWSATFGPRIYHGNKCIYHYHIWKLKFDEKKISKVFLNYLLEQDVENIKSQRTGGTMVHITKATMESRQLLFPSLPEQKKIADCLSSLDEVINKMKAELSAWKEFKKGLLQQIFPHLCPYSGI